MKSDHKQKIESLLEEQCIDHLPMYINYITDKKRQSDGFVVRFPNTKPKEVHVKITNTYTKIHISHPTQTHYLEPTDVGLRGANPYEGLRYSLVPTRKDGYFGTFTSHSLLSPAQSWSVSLRPSIILSQHRRASRTSQLYRILFSPPS